MMPRTQHRPEKEQFVMPIGIPRFQLDYNSFGRLHKMVAINPLFLAANSRFASRLALHFPEVAEQIDENDFGILHLEVGALKLATRAAILNHDWNTVRLHFAFVAQLLTYSGAELRDALSVSYVGNLLYGETAIEYAQTRQILPRPLAITLAKIEHHYESLMP